MSLDASGYLLNNKAFFVANPAREECAVLNSAPLWAMLKLIARAKRGGYLEAEAQYVGALPKVEAGHDASALATAAKRASEASTDRLDLVRTVHARLGDLHPSALHLSAFANWPDLDFAALRALLAKRCKVDIPVGERDQWDRYLTARRAEAAAFATTIADAEREIDDRVYRLFDLSKDDIALIEATLARP